MIIMKKRMLLITVLFSIMLTDDKLIIDMFYSDNHVEVSLDAFLASEEYAKESIKNVELVFDQNAACSIVKQGMFDMPCFNNRQISVAYSDISSLHLPVCLPDSGSTSRGCGQGSPDS